MSIVETILVFVVIPLAVYGVVSMATLRRRFGGNPRYRPGQEWDYPPVWWTANPQGADISHDTAEQEAGATRAARGGASGSW